MVTKKQQEKLDVRAGKMMLVEGVMGLLEKSYKRNSGVYQTAREGLFKLTKEELDALWAMVLTTVK